MKINVTIQYLFGTLFIIFSLLPSSRAVAQNIEFGRSYINITKGLNGGTVEPGDTLEIRASFVVKSGTYDSCSFVDVIPAGTTYIKNTIKVLTNEGLIYKTLTDSIPDDPGWINGTTVHINLGYTSVNYATAFRRGRIVNTNRPTFGGACIMIAAYRIVVTAAYNTQLNLGAGFMTYKPSVGAVTTFNFPSRTIAIYPNYGICSNTVGANSIGTEFNGTFGTGKPRNRGTSANVPAGYTYSIFNSGGPNDYYYGVANNTSVNTGYTTLNNWPIPDNTHRVFGYWDVIGDHTGALNPILGNPAADTVANPNAGYMLVVNAAYRIDSAFQQTITGLCPNTYYEISCWMRNICSKCGNDSAGVGAISAGYKPTGPGDSSGVKPNISFGVDGIDYYTTGNITYSGKWVKKGFTFLTGAAQTSFVLKFFNNAPGGGGNDWALDDISVATCSPNLAFTPTNNPSICKGNVVSVGAYVRSFFNNYTFFKWQKSTDNGVTWTNTATTGTGAPTWNGTAYEYFTAYPPFVAAKSDSGTKYKVMVASTLTNLSNVNCSFTDVTSLLTLTIIDCGIPLSTDIVSFSGKIENGNIKLNWTTTREDEKLQYIIERSSDGINFSKVGSVDGQYVNSDLNYYSWSEPDQSSKELYYRIKLSDVNGKQKISRTVKLSSGNETIGFVHLPNPFSDKLVADVNVNDAQVINLQLIDNSGRIIRRQQYTLASGSNSIVMEQTNSLPAGIYTLQLRSQNNVINKRVMKQ
ncbi:MAG TPA: T9SS type A sorting domain-containing protein [Flavisolibacter sp.]|nr:T9SS type A sorting domain-containing protein [Flavisolibacter sp.]